jgi:hypothetical protein
VRRRLDGETLGGTARARMQGSLAAGHNRHGNKHTTQKCDEPCGDL